MAGWTRCGRSRCSPLAYVAYRLVRGLAEGDADAAFAHARDLISLERGMHLFVEPTSRRGRRAATS